MKHITVKRNTVGELIVTTDSHLTLTIHTESPTLYADVEWVDAENYTRTLSWTVLDEDDHIERMRERGSLDDDYNPDVNIMEAAIMDLHATLETYLDLEDAFTGDTVADSEDDYTLRSEVERLNDWVVASEYTLT